MKTYEIVTREQQPQVTAVVKNTVTVAEIGPWLAGVYESVAACVQRQGAEIVGPPFARYRVAGPERFSVEAGFPVSRPVHAEDRVHASRLPGGHVAETVHDGPYDQMVPAYAALTRWVEERGGTPAGDPWEVYLTNPATRDDAADWRTAVVQPYLIRRTRP